MLLRFPALRADLAFVLGTLPALASTGVVAAAVAPPLAAALGLAADHCLGHGHHVHLCFLHSTHVRPHLAAVGAFAGFLKGRGLSPGDRVAIFLENCPQFAIAYYGSLRAGGIVVCLNPMHKAVELVLEFQDCGERVLVTSDLAWDSVQPMSSPSFLSAT